ncbi:unnamed protein product [Paramecium octaurelia]|uniref:Uncharacterized protein n=1 Tax=Paramecium octaurelia TaxID=43137 RepID=A0A8S1YJZ0_PAROT|nr:unnamed protein product [Paramecium octaurelia]
MVVNLDEQIKTDDIYLFTKCLGQIVNKENLALLNQPQNLQRKKNCLDQLIQNNDNRKENYFIQKLNQVRTWKLLQLIDQLTEQIQLEIQSKNQSQDQKVTMRKHKLYQKTKKDFQLQYTQQTNLQERRLSSYLINLGINQILVQIMPFYLNYGTHRFIKSSELLINKQILTQNLHLKTPCLIYI